MYESQPKKLLIMNILDILQKYSDEKHHLSQKDIIDTLEREYDMKADRKSIRRNIMNLMDFGYDIYHSESIRKVPIKDENGKDVYDPKTGEKVMEENCIWSDFYLVRDFDDSELRLLIDAVLVSHHIPSKQRKELVEKIEGLSSEYFSSRVKHISTIPDEKSNNKSLFLNIDYIDEAISQKKKITFKYLEYDTDKKMHPKKCEDGSERIYLVSPYQMVAREGKYYLICNYDKYDDISNYRIDRITDIKITDEKIKSFKKLKGSNKAELNLADYMKKHPYMYSSDDVMVTFRVTLPMISDVIDMFGTGVRFSDKDETGVSVSVTANERAVEQFALNFAPDVMILRPEKLRNKVAEQLKKAAEAYGIMIK